MIRLKLIYQKLSAPLAEVPQYLQGYYPALDGVRAIAILMVVLAHIGFNKYLKPLHFYIVGDTGVHIFFVLSGFLITTLLLKEQVQNGCISLRKFYIRRALRILPVAYLFLLVLIALNLSFGLHIRAADFLASFLFYKNMPMPNEPFTAHFWSLAVEEQFYLIFPFLLAANVNRYILIAIGIIILVPLIAILGHFGVDILNDNTVGMLLSKICMYAFWKGPVIILIGSVASLLMFKGVMETARLKAGYFTSFLLLATAITITVGNFPLYVKYISEYISCILIAPAMVLCTANKDFLSRILSISRLRKIGVLSYSIYIWQELFIGVRPWQPWLYFLNNQPLWLVVVVKLVAIAGIAIASYSFESIFLRLKRRYQPLPKHN